ncbi:hypothetical protein G6F31_014491 [Rhizopus arrhizus]|nr:hypothetical protein G6F31_014491 [Rhizopus arrhizus]
MAPAQGRGQAARGNVRTELPRAAQAHRRAGHVIGVSGAVQGGRATRFLEVARTQLVPGQAGVGFDGVGIAQRQVVAQFGEHLRRRRAIGRLKPLVQAAGRHVALGVDVVPGVGRARHEPEMARTGLDIASAEQRRRIAVDVAARRRIGDRVVAADVAQRATQAPAAAYGAVAADEEPAGRLAHAGRVAVTAELAPASEDDAPNWAVGRPASVGASRLPRKWASGSVRTVSAWLCNTLAVLAYASPDSIFKAERASPGVMVRTAAATWLAPVSLAAAMPLPTTGDSVVVVVVLVDPFAVDDVPLPVDAAPFPAAADAFPVDAEPFPVAGGSSLSNAPPTLLSLPVSPTLPIGTSLRVSVMKAFLAS